MKRPLLLRIGRIVVALVMVPGLVAVGHRAAAAGRGTRVASAADGIWSQLSLPPGPPAPSYNGSLAYDSLRHRAILHRNQLWTLDLANPVAWVQLPATGTVPGNRTHSLIVYDSANDRVVLHGGGLPSSSNETYFLQFDDAPGSSGTWQLISTNPAPTGGFPAPRHGHTGIYDPVRQELLFYGGYSGPCGYSVSVWALPLTGAPTWRNPNTAGYGGGVFRPISGYDAARRQLIVYGGHYHVVCGGQFDADSWANTLASFPLDGGAWVPRWPNAAGPVQHSRGAVGAYDSSRDRILALPIVEFNGPQDSTVVAFSPVTAAWDTLSPVGTGPGGGTGALYDPVGDRLLVGRESVTTTWWFLTFTGTSGVDEPGRPEVSRLLAPHPNPVRDHLVVRFELSSPGPVDVSVVDVQGRLVAVLLRGEATAGGHELRWDVRGPGGSRVAAGLYFVRLGTADGVRSTRVVVAG